MLRWSLALWLSLGIALAAGAVRAEPVRSDAVALLPLDAAARFEIYGQPVANEIARALTAGGIQVVVVGATMAVPATARLVVVGKIAAGKGDAIALSLHVRDPRDGTVLDKLDAVAANLSQIDRAAADLAARALPTVRARLVARSHNPGPSQPEPPPGRFLKHAVRSLIAVGATATAREGGGLAAALGPAAEAWVSASQRSATRIAAASLAPADVERAGADRGVVFDVVGYAVTRAPAPAGQAVPIARARVRVRVADAASVLFDRVVVTDSVVGDRGMTDAALAARVAAEVLAIAAPHVVRSGGGW